MASPRVFPAWRLAALPLLILSAACGSDDGDSPPVQPPVFGTFRLTTINDAALPFLTSAASASCSTGAPGAARREVTSGMLYARVNGGDSLVVQVRTSCVPTDGSAAPAPTSERLTWDTFRVIGEQYCFRTCERPTVEGQTITFSVEIDGTVRRFTFVPQG